MKLALIRAVSANPAAPIITADMISWARDLVEHCIDTLLREADENVAETPYARDVQAGLKYLRKHGKSSSAEMFKKGWTLPAIKRAEILDSLVESGQIIEILPAEGVGGRPATRYVINPNG